MVLFKSVISLFELVYKEGEREWLNEDRYKELLNELYIELENGEITEEEYEEEEEKILDQLRAIRKYKRENDIEEHRE